MNPRINPRGMRVVQRKDWPGITVAYKADDGEWKQKKCPLPIRTEAKAFAFVEAWLAEKKQIAIEEQLAAEAAKEAASRATIAKLDALWSQFRENKIELNEGGISHATWKADRSIMKKHILPLFGERVPADIAISEYRSFVLKLSTEKKLGGQTVRNVANTFTKFFDDAIGEEWLDMPANPMLHKKVREVIPKAKSARVRKVRPHYSLEQFRALVTHPDVDGHHHLWYLLAGLTGLDAGELAGLKWVDVHLDHEVPHIDVERASQIRNKKGFAKIGALKRPSRHRKVPLHREAAKALRAWKKGTCAHWLGHDPELNDPVFPSPTASHWRPHLSHWLHGRTDNKSKGDLEKAGLPKTYAGKRLDFKALRRSFATWLANAGVNDTIRGRLMGHADASVTDYHYSDTALATLAEAVALIKLDISVNNVVNLPLKAAEGA